ncbi:outer membrane protein assembly factor BamD [Rufibacter glacialis]|uniref:Outer membrane protein assembly factor BamD n=1 Tax=Rufibacter glacialis TaxID=1259555 RepID=A0A5M8QLA1_9BACT|nr:outer membrane protein assembly factor BamD [Rufibacter glacialis]KAA6435760.1 outer membrane protein assembly factor BamD [Rufibacter glacialis]GGK66267.1 outer membrane protein assembly factor BamD [Rufibacter glacialis]
MTKRHLSYLPILLIVLLLGACGQYNKILKSDDVDKKYAAALSYYEKEDYDKAGALLEDLMPLLKGRSEYERANFLYAYTKYHQHLYLESSFHFTSFGQTFPRSQFAEEAAFMNAKSLSNESPSVNLDQQSTAQAMAALQEFMRRYPQSKYMADANKIYDELSRKIEVKAFDVARQYYKLTNYDPQYYKAAVVALENFRKSFPSSIYNEEAAYLRIDAQYNYARESIESKQKDRYLDVISMYQTFVDTYPKSKFLRNAEGLYESSREAVEKLGKSSQPAAATATNN